MTTSAVQIDPTHPYTRMLLPFCPAHVATLDEEERRTFHAVVSFIYIGATVVFGFATMNVKQGNLVAGGVQYVCVGIILAMLFMNRRGHAHVAAHVCVAMTTVTIFIGMWMGGGMSAAAIVFLPMIPAVGFLSVGASGGLAGAIQAILVVATVASLEKMGFTPRYEPPDKLFIKRLAESIGMIIQIWLVCSSFFRLKQEALALLSQKRDEIASLFDNMRQGVLAFTVEGRITGQTSASAREIFGTGELEGRDVADLLYGDQPAFDLGRQEFMLWLEALPLATPEEVAGMMTLAPDGCVRATATGEQHLRLEFRPILQDGALTRVMLLVTDETEQVMYRRAIDAEKAANERALERMRRLAAGGAHAFLETLRGAEARLDEVARTLSRPLAQLEPAQLHAMFRHAHTVKGDARLYDLDDLGKATEHLEDLFAEARAQLFAGRPMAFSELPRALDLLRSAQVAIDAAREKLVEASPIGAAILDQVTIRETDLRALRQQVMRMHMVFGEDITPLSEVTSRLLSRPFGESASGLTEAVARWSEQQGKRAMVMLQGREVSVSPELHEVLPGVLGHLVRNAIAHGIESPDNRLRSGKPERGLVRISCEDGPSGPSILVEDDGAGIDVAELVQRAGAAGLASASDPMELLFVDGLTTADDVDALRGRGVGMSAVRADLARVGYGIRVSTEPGAFTRFVLGPEASGKRGKAA